MLATTTTFTRSPGHDIQFVAMLDAFRPSGGLARAEDLASQLCRRATDSESQLARWIAYREAVSFRWAESHWMPVFQFRWPNLELQPRLGNVLAELRPVMDEWELAEWFCETNGWLGGSTPAERMATHPADVFHAARADRFALS